MKHIANTPLLLSSSKPTGPSTVYHQLFWFVVLRTFVSAHCAQFDRGLERRAPYSRLAWMESAQGART